MNRYKLTPCPSSKALSGIIGWYIDRPKGFIECIEKTLKLHVAGWALSLEEKITIIAQKADEEIEFNLSVARPDVIQTILNSEAHQKSETCGFDFKITLPEHEYKDFKLYLRYNNQNHLIALISKTSQAKVIIGKNDWLFLDNDTNRSIDQFTGKLRISDSSLSDWREHLKDIESASLDMGFEWILSIAPAKELIFPEYHPYSKADETTIDQFINHIKLEKNISYPYKELYQNRELCYWKGDTHWTEFGAFIASKDIAKKLHLQENYNNTKSYYTITYPLGDLSSNIENPSPAPKLTLHSTPNSIKAAFDNEIQNNGRIKSFKNINCRNDLKAIIFGGSSSDALLPFLAAYFEETIFAHTVAAFDLELINKIKPTHVILQTNSRFLITAPTKSAHFSIWQVIEKKLSELDADKLKEMNEALSTFNNTFSQLHNDLIKKILEAK